MFSSRKHDQAKISSRNSRLVTDNNLDIEGKAFYGYSREISKIKNLQKATDEEQQIQIIERNTGTCTIF